MNTQEFLLWEMRSRDTIDVKRCYVDIAGDLVSGILLSQVIYWHLPDEQGKTRLRVHHDGYNWLAKKRDDWWHECRISSKQFDRAVDILEKKGLIVTKLYRFGGSPTKHIRMDWDGFFQSLKSLEDADFTQRSKSNLPKGQNPIYPNGKMEIDQTGNSLTESTTQITSETTSENKSPCSPPGDMNASEGLVEVEVMEAGQEAVDTPSLENPKESSLLEQNSNPDEDKISGGGVATLNVCAKKIGATKTQNQKMMDCFLAAYLEHKPSNFTNHPKLSDKHVKVLSKLTAKFKERSLDVFTAALIWCREGDNPWWYKQRRSLDNLMSNGKIEEYADNHFDALEADPAYCDRVEGRAVSKDPKRNNGFQVFNEQGKEVTGASARAAAAVASDPMLALFLEQI